MNTIAFKRNLPTLANFWERRQKARQNQLPKHLRPPERWPIAVQLVLNVALIATNLTLIWNKDDYLTDVGPAIPMTISMLFLFYVVITAIRLRTKFRGIAGAKLAKANIVLTALSFLTWAATIALFLPDAA